MTPFQRILPRYTLAHGDSSGCVSVSDVLPTSVLVVVSIGELNGVPV